MKRLKKGNIVTSLKSTSKKCKCIEDDESNEDDETLSKKPTRKVVKKTLNLINLLR